MVLNLMVDFNIEFSLWPILMDFSKLGIKVGIKIYLCLIIFKLTRCLYFYF